MASGASLRSETLPATAAALAAFHRAAPRPRAATAPTPTRAIQSATAAAVATFAPCVEACTRSAEGWSHASTRASSGMSTPVSHGVTMSRPSGMRGGTRLLDSELTRLSTEYRAAVLESQAAALQQQLDVAEARLADQDRLIPALQEALRAKDLVIEALEEQRGSVEVQAGR